MSDSKELADCYHGTLRLLHELMLTSSPAEKAGEVITAICSGLIRHLKRAHVAMQSVVPEEQRDTFSGYLRKLADAFEKEVPKEPE